MEKQLKPRGAARFEYKGVSNSRPNWSNSWKGCKQGDNKAVSNDNKGKGISGSKETSKLEINKEKNRDTKGPFTCEKQFSVSHLQFS